MSRAIYKKHDEIDTIVYEFEAAGFYCEIVPTNGGHFKVNASRGELKLFCFSSGSPSDRRGVYNVRARVRRTIRSAPSNLATDKSEARE